MSTAITLTLWVYSHIAGTEALVQALIHKANQRAVSDKVVYFSRWNIHTYLTVLRYYAVHYYPAAVSIFLLWIIHIIRKSNNSFKMPSVFTVITVAIFLHHIVFLNFTAENDFSVLKTAIPVLIIWVFLQSKSEYSKITLIMSYTILVISALYVVFKGINHKKSNQIQNFASELVKLSPDNEMLILHSSSSISPQVMYYAQRNVYMNVSQEQVKKHLKNHNLKKAVILYTDWQYNILRSEHIQGE
jgi:hypothetical protein